MNSNCVNPFTRKNSEILRGLCLFHARHPLIVIQTLMCDVSLNVHRWAKENKLDQLTFARQKVAYCYLAASATVLSHDASEARMSCAKNGILTTLVDDFFDIGGSREELLNLVSLVEKYDLLRMHFGILFITSSSICMSNLFS